MGQDGHDRRQKKVATGYAADVGFDVDGPLFKHQQKKQKL
jgi:methylmalonyl-CoA mutase cobalamin-binding domain/chain